MWHLESVESRCARQCPRLGVHFRQKYAIVCRSALQEDRAALFHLLAAGELYGFDGKPGAALSAKNFQQNISQPTF
jgi:hypothetical protein